ncbi:hypothetical protein [Microbacterium suaedae]|uniref:hypothetical protein n=1 Tax=Microbacterium suaedae TaxID=2067813 RepID=UPI000DA21498|nr:hypothetical protein [Microbacterium suaedae]
MAELERAYQPYEASYRSIWDAGDGSLGHLIIRRLNDHEVIAEIPATDDDEARRLIDGFDWGSRSPVIERHGR